MTSPRELSVTEKQQALLNRLDATLYYQLDDAGRHALHTALYNLAIARTPPDDDAKGRQLADAEQRIKALRNGPAFWQSVANA